MMRLSTNGTKRILEELRALGGRALALTANVTAPAQLQPAVERVEQTLGPVSILVNNAGIGAAFAPSYSAAKRAVVQLTKSMVIGPAPCNVQVNAVAPIETALPESMKTTPVYQDV